MREELRKHARVLIVDDEPQNVRYLADVLEWAGYVHVEGVTESRQVLGRFLQFEPDLIVLDLLMPDMDGFAVMEELRAHVPEDGYLPILVLTSDDSRETRRRALSAGARDFLTKPMSPTEVRIRVENLLEMRFLYLRCRRQEELLEGFHGENDGAASARLELALVETWAATLESERPGGRAARQVARTAIRAAERLDLEPEDTEALRRAALLHRLVLGEAGSQAALTALEESEHPSLRRVATLLRHAGERWDGGGPLGLEGVRIPLPARVLSVAVRLHGRAPGDGVDGPSRLEAEAGGRLDPAVVETVLATEAAPRS